MERPAARCAGDGRARLVARNRTILELGRWGGAVRLWPNTSKGETQSLRHQRISWLGEGSEVVGEEEGEVGCTSSFGVGLGGGEGDPKRWRGDPKTSGVTRR